MNKSLWLKTAAGISFAMAVIQLALAISPAAAAYFQAPPSLLENRLMLLIMGGGAALILVVFGLYALSGAGSIRHLPLLCLVLIVISSIFLLRGLFIIITILKLTGVLQGENLVQGVVSHFVFLAAGVAFTVGTILNWKQMRLRSEAGYIQGVTEINI